jgi:hypothetical protein
MYSTKEVKSSEERKTFNLASTTEDEKQIWPVLKHEIPLWVCDYIHQFFYFVDWPILNYKSSFFYLRERMVTEWVKFYL